MLINKKLPILTREQAEAIEFVIQHGEEDYVLGTVANPDDRVEGSFQVLNDIPLRDLAMALYSGFEVELEPEQAILEEYKRVCKNADSDDYDRSFEGKIAKDTIEFVLKKLGKKIEGIN